MSANTLATRSAGQVILDSFFNDLRSAFATDLVGRDVNGVPVSGNNLGNSAYPWGTLYTNQMIVGGVALSTTSLERPPYQIISGKTRSGSNQPLFLSPAGSSPSFSLLASTTNLVLSIKGTAVTWTADKNSIPVTTAPASNNTCTVNDATAAGQAATRQWGEYGSGSPYYNIIVNNMLSGISSRTGSYQAFKTGTEYFLAYVETSTLLSRAFRGFFFNSSGSPVKRVVLNNFDTITLMNLGYVFADADGTTVDTIFVGAGVNNGPSWSYSAPSSPATGDYWYDLGNQVWKTWSGAAWGIVNRILVGMVVADATNCVAARSLDFYGLCRADNTVELVCNSATTMRGVGAFERVNVNGANVSFGAGRASWDTASNLAASTDRYNASVTASTNEYFYVTDQGETKISDMEPFWRPDLLGYYHPFNPWRCVGQAGVDASAHFTSSGVVVFGKRLMPAVGQQVSSSSGNFFGSATTPTPVTNLSVNYTTSGRLVNIALIPDGANTPTTALSYIGITNPGSNNNTTALHILIYRDSTFIGGSRVWIQPGNNLSASLWSFVPPGSANTVDTPPPGNYTYSIKYLVADAAHVGSVQYCKLAIWES